ncbi:N-formylglutamate deformylase [Luteimonas fraxinea]|uniref:N-formylglutamate deformylase n=1 Tax=Luteimonas fraxinea TaxID=2901869 RepID=A0ABS8UFL8_9GAMM|nr:N-formylglutamate deformylase [Luteimonas fraxinea]MCD9097844.1 N-formylglutamate deformylase [Luteimonas fraxinea]UHH09414.1 N-formylglutamate deformylase [Luteimonas fraxinea]
MRTDLFDLHRGDAPLLISIPHNGTHVPDAIASQLTDEARRVPDTDWHVADLYAFARELGASMLVPTHSRYVVDLNRSQDDVSLYPGQNTTGLCPVVRFDGGPVYLPDAAPTPDEVTARVDTYWRPYHAALADEIARLRAAHGRVVLWEAHSIRGTLPFLFEGPLPDLNLGTASGASCSPELEARMTAQLRAQSTFGFVANGRFKGGHITRHYGQPETGVEAVQLEISQRCYMDEETFAWDAARAGRLQPLLRTLIEDAIGYATGDSRRA